MSEKHQMPGYRPSALGLATKVRMGEPGIEMSAYSLVTIICLLEESLAKRAEPVNSSDRVVGFSLGQLHSRAPLACGHDAPPISAFVQSRNYWDVPSSAAGRRGAELVRMVAKSFGWIDDVQPTVVAGVENRTQKLERTCD